MKRVLLCGIVVALAIALPKIVDASVAAVVAGTCEQRPTNYKNCAARCDDLAGCKKCCGRGEFSDKWDKKCKDRCTSTFTSVIADAEAFLPWVDYLP